MENFGFDFAEDAAAAALGESSLLLGEKRLKERYIPEQVQTRALLTDYPVLERVGELNLLTITAKSGLLRALDEKGLTLGQLEALLPVAEKLNLLKVVQNPIIYNLLVPLLVEPAPYLLPAVVNLVKLDATIWTGLAAVFLALETKGIAAGDGVNVPLLIPVVLFGGLGQLLGGKIDVSGVSAPEFSAPAFSVPEFSAPEFSAPESESSSKPGFSLSIGRPRA